MAHLQEFEHEHVQLYVKNTSNCEGLPLQTFELLSPTWTGPSIEIPFVDPSGDDDLVVCGMVGWTDLFGGQPCWVRVAWARWLRAAWARRIPQAVELVEDPAGWPWRRAVGVLVWGGNSGLRVTGPGMYEDGFGLPVMWLEDVTLLPDDVRAVIGDID